MSVYVFLGPSLPRVAAIAQFDGVVYMPPIAMGDLYTLVMVRARQGDHVAIIDGLFEQMPSVWHKEILYALSRGIHVYGGASMGALRAAELHPFGMVGIGRIFEAFRDEELHNDDEVAVAHADETAHFRSLSTALVSIRFGLEAMERAGELPPFMRQELVAAMAALPYGERCWPAVAEAARRLGASTECAAAILRQAHVPDAKSVDAATLLRHVREHAAGERKPHRANFTFQNTSFWTALQESLAIRVETERYTEEEEEGLEEGGQDSRQGWKELAAFVRAGDPERDRWLEGALLDRLTVAFSRQFAPGPTELREAEQRIARSHGIAAAAGLQHWRREQQISVAEWKRILEVAARRHWLRQALGNELDLYLLGRLKAAGQFARLRAKRELARTTIVHNAFAKPSLVDFGLSPESLERWYTKRFGRMSPDPLTHARMLNFASLREFIDALLECYLSEAPSLGPEGGNSAAPAGKEIGHAAAEFSS